MIPFAATSNILPWMGALAMSLSSFCVCMNALRINLFNPYKIRRIRKDHNNTGYIYGISIEGMICENCVRHVREAFNKMGLEVIEISLLNNNALVKANKHINNNKVIKTINNIGYKVINIKEVKNG